MTKIHILLLIIILTLLTPWSLLAATRASPLPAALVKPMTPSQKGVAAIELERVEQSTLYFTVPEIKETPAAETETATPAKLPEVPKPIKTTIDNLNYLGVLREPGSYPFFFFTGKPCKSCPEEPQIFVFKPGQPPGKEKIATFVWPGKIFDPKTRAVLMESRGFLGNCIRGSSKDVFLVYQRERVDRRKSLQPSVFVAEPAENHLSERLLERNFPRIDHTLKLVRSKQCKEIEGRNRLMLTKPLDLSPRHQDGESDEDPET